MPGTIWNDVLRRVETKVKHHVYATWFQSTSLLSDEGHTLQVQVTDGMVADWLAKHYAGVLDEALSEMGRPGVRLVFVASAREAHAPEPAISVDAVVAPDSFPVSGASPVGESLGLSPRYSFETFIVGSSNQFAHAACRAVAEAPSRSYNPLFLYGGVGLGKTHLMHAIGHYVLTTNPALKLTYISGERFMNEVINAIRYEGILEFRERYRSVDVLLVDDVQFIVGKERTQTEFFHTFNALHDAQKQIVLSSDLSFGSATGASTCCSSTTCSSSSGRSGRRPSSSTRSTRSMTPRSRSCSPRTVPPTRFPSSRNGCGAASSGVLSPTSSPRISRRKSRF